MLIPLSASLGGKIRIVPKGPAPDGQKTPRIKTLDAAGVSFESGFKRLAAQVRKFSTQKLIY
jgi:hypothetical protein